MTVYGENPCENCGTVYGLFPYRVPLDEEKAERLGLAPDEQGGYILCEDCKKEAFA